MGALSSTSRRSRRGHSPAHGQSLPHSSSSSSSSSSSAGSHSSTSQPKALSAFAFRRPQPPPPALPPPPSAPAAPPAPAAPAALPPAPQAAPQAAPQQQEARSPSPQAGRAGWAAVAAAARPAVHEHARQADVSTLSQLLQAQPDLAAQLNADGELPLHAAARSRLPTAPQAVKVLLEAHPDACSSTDASGRFPLHLAAAHGCAAAASVLLAAGPHILGLRGGPEGNLPLHEAAGSAAASLPMLRVLHTAYARALQDANFRGQTPVHIAAARQPWPVVQQLLAWWPGAAMVPDSTGRLPLHIALQENRGEQGAAVVAGLLRHCPDAVRRHTASGQLPLHLACLYHESLSSLRQLVALYPESVAVPLNGQLPLHLLAEHGGDAQAGTRAVWLLRVYPAAAHKGDANGNLPLQLCRAASVARALAAADPETAGVALQRVVSVRGSEIEHGAAMTAEVFERRQLNLAAGGLPLQLASVECFV